MKLLIFDYIVVFIILIAIRAPWWAWLIYFGSALLRFVIWALSNPNDANKKNNPLKISRLFPVGRTGLEPVTSAV